MFQGLPLSLEPHMRGTWEAVWRQDISPMLGNAVVELCISGCTRSWYGAKGDTGHAGHESVSVP